MRTVAKTAISHQRPRSLVAQKMAAPSRRSLVAQKVVEVASKKAARSRTTSPAKPTTDASPTPTSTERLSKGRLSESRERESVARALLVQKGRKYDALVEKMRLLRNQLKKTSSASSSLMSQVPGSGVSTPPRSVSTPLACAAVAAQAIADHCADNDGNAYCSKLGCCAQIGHLRKVLEKSTADVLFARYIVASRRSALVSEVS